MPNPDRTKLPNLDEIRQQIDATDAALLDLLQKRARLVAHIGAAKAASDNPNILRPAREAQQMRKFIAWHKATQSPIPLAGFLAIWREIIGSAVSQQQPLQVRFVASDSSAGHEGIDMAALAMMQFGCAADYQSCADNEAALSCLSDGNNMVAVLPMQGDWWVRLADGVAIFAALPLFAERPQALCVGKIMPKASGDDITLICAPANALPPKAQIIAEAGDKRLAQMDGFIRANDLPASVTWVGAYARIVM